MNKKLSAVTLLAVLSLMFFVQLSTVYAAKPTTVSFTSPSGQFSPSQDPSIIFGPDNKPIMGQFYWSGTMRGDIAGPFTSIDIARYYYNKAGTLDHTAISQDIVVTTSTGDVKIHTEVTVKIGEVPVAFQKPGTWMIVGGTGDWATISGKGDYRMTFQFYGKIS